MTYCIYGLLLILGIETTHLGVLGIAINMRPNYPHLIISSLCRDSVLWWVNSCSERANTKYDLVYDVDQGSNPSPSLRLGVDRWIGTFLSLSPFYLSIFSPYHMLTLDHNSNTSFTRAYKDKYLTSLYPSHALVSWLTFYEAWTIVWFSQKCINYVSVPFTICVFYKAVRKTSFSINQY